MELSAVAAQTVPWVGQLLKRVRRSQPKVLAHVLTQMHTIESFLIVLFCRSYGFDGLTSGQNNIAYMFSAARCYFTCALCTANICEVNIRKLDKT